MSRPTEFDADKKAGKREGIPVTIGERKFLPRRKGNKVMRRYRAVQREHRALGRQIEGMDVEMDGVDPGRRIANLEEERRELAPDNPRCVTLGEEIAKALEQRRKSPPDVDRLNEIEEEQAELEERQEDLAHRLLATLLRPEGDDGTGDVDEVTAELAEHIADTLDLEDVRALRRFLMPEVPEESDPPKDQNESTST